MPLYVGAAAGAVSLAWYLLVMRRGRRVGGQRSVARALHGPALSDGLASPGDADYDAKLRELWGGPAPKHFDTALADWPRRFPAGAGRLAVVTGGAAGIGFYVAKLLAAQGFTVVVPARPGFEHEAAGAAASIAAALGPGADGAARVVVPKAALDLGSLASTRAFAAEVRSLCYKNARKQGRAGGGLALLCLNAGRGGSKGDPRALTADGLEAIVQVNALGHFLLTAELLPELRRAAAAAAVVAGGGRGGARVVSQSSGARCNWPLRTSDIPQRLATDLRGDGAEAAGSFDAWSQYQLSKAANCLFTLGLSTRLAAAAAACQSAPGVGCVTAAVADPGFASTGVNIQHNLGHSLLGAPDGLLPTQVMHDVAGQHAADGALPMVLACLAEDLEPNAWYTPAGGIAGAAARGDPAAHKEADRDPLNAGQPGSPFGAGAAEAFWQLAVEATGAKWEFESKL